MYSALVKGCGMGPWLVFVSPCFRESVVATCKIGSFLCSLDNLLQKNVIVLFFGNQISNGAHLKKGLFLTYFSHFLVTRESYKNSFSTYLTHIHAHILLTLLTFFALPILKKIRIYQIRFLFGMSPGLYFIKVKNILSLKFKNNLIFHFVKELKKNRFLNSFIK